MTHKPTERGQALILIALAAIGLFAFAALAIDGSRSFSNKRHAQNAADTSVLTAALKYIRTGGNFSAAVSAAQARAASNGYADDSDVSDGYATSVQVNLCSDSGVTCDALPTGAVTSEYIRVRIISTIPTTFGRVLGRKTLTAAVEAIAHVKALGSTSSGSNTTGAAMVSTDDNPTENQCFRFNGNATLVTHDSGISVNCGGAEALYLNGSTVFTPGGDSYVTGCTDYPAKGTIVGSFAVNCWQPKQTYSESTYAHLNTMPPVPTCSSNGTVDTAHSGSPSGYNKNGQDITISGVTVTLNGGNWGNIIVQDQGSNGGKVIFNPGTYCISGNFNINGSKSTAEGHGLVQWVMPNADWNAGSQNTYTFDNLELFTVNGTMDIKGTLNATRLRFYSSGTGNSTIEATSSVTSQDAYFYLAKGAIKWNGGSVLNVHAPPDGDPYLGGTLIYQPWDNHQASNINGGSYTRIWGTVLSPNSEFTFNGGANFELHGQVIAYKYTLDGNGNVEIWYLNNPLLNPPSVPNPEIEFIK